MYMLDTIEEEGVLEEQEKELVQSALEFNDTTVEDILTPVSIWWPWTRTPPRRRFCRSSPRRTSPESPYSETWITSSV